MASKLPTHQELAEALRGMLHGTGTLREITGVLAQYDDAMEPQECSDHGKFASWEWDKAGGCPECMREEFEAIDKAVDEQGF